MRLLLGLTGWELEIYFGQWSIILEEKKKSLLLTLSVTQAASNTCTHNPAALVSASLLYHHSHSTPQKMTFKNTGSRQDASKFYSSEKDNLMPLSLYGHKANKKQLKKMDMMLPRGILILHQRLNR